MMLQVCHENLVVINQALFVLCSGHPPMCDCHSCRAWDGVIQALETLDDHKECGCNQIAVVAGKVQREGGIK